MEVNLRYLSIFGLLIIMIRAYFNFGLHKNVKKLSSFQEFDKQCMSLAKTDVVAKSCEDFRFISENIIISGDGEVMKYLEHADDAPTVQHFIAIDLTNQKLREIKLENFPKDVVMRPHGFDVRNGKVYVVNHANNGDERVDIFQISGEKNVDTVQVKWLKVVRPPVPTATLNSVAAVSDDEIYVTHWLPYAAPKDGLHHPKGASEIGLIVGNLAYWLGMGVLKLPPFLYGSTATYRCLVDSGKCERAYSNFLSNNGIVADRTGEFLFIVDCGRSELNVFKRNKTDGKLTLQLVKPLLHNADNVMISPKPNESGLIELWLGTMPDTVAYLAEQHPIPGGLVQAFYDPKTNSMSLNDVFIHNGKIVSGVATAALWNKKVLMSGPKAYGGIVICDLEAK
jgi:hypothetical protein